MHNKFVSALSDNWIYFILLKNVNVLQIYLQKISRRQDKLKKTSHETFHSDTIIFGYQLPEKK